MAIDESTGWRELRADYAFLDEFFAVAQVPPGRDGDSLAGYLDGLDWELRRDKGWLEPGRLAAELRAFVDGRLGDAGAGFALESLRLRGGRDKDGRPEGFDLVFRPGEVVAVVGPTGSGKSRLLADIECLAQGDTPTGRTVELNGAPPGDDFRFSVERKLVAQLSQNMNFIMDLSVGDFLRLHADSRLLPEPEALIERVWRQAVALAGEPFTAATALTALSGGQSRALMIADAALLSPKPIVLIDEIENAGVDRLKALELFRREGKIVFLSTHDPLLAVSAGRRLAIRNGAVAKVIDCGEGERALLPRLNEIEAFLAELRGRLRAGGEL